MPRRTSQRSSGPAPRAVQVQPPLVPGSLLHGRYRVLHVLGTGAFGRVYLAEDSEEPDHPPLAIKELLAREFASPDDQQDAITWFKREVSTLLTLDHPGIPAIHGYWTASRSEGPLYLAMDYIPGKNLADLQVLAGGHLPWKQVVAWAIDLCDVFAYLHSRIPSFVFRDLKPANVLIDARTGTPVLIDFGLARQLAPVTGTAIGTWGYVPFEQVLGKAEPRSDLYALAALMHELLTNRHPTSEYRQLLRNGLDVEGALRQLFPPIATLVSGVPTALSRILQQGTAFAPEDRFATAEALRDALRDIMELVDPAVSAVHTVPAGSTPQARAMPMAPDHGATAGEPSTSLLSRMLKPPPPLVAVPPDAPLQADTVAPVQPAADSGQSLSSARPHDPPAPADRARAGSDRPMATTGPMAATQQPVGSASAAPPADQAASDEATDHDRIDAADSSLPSSNAQSPQSAPVSRSAEEYRAFEQAMPALEPYEGSAIPGGGPPASVDSVAVVPAAPRPAESAEKAGRSRWRFRAAASGTVSVGAPRLVVSATGTGQYTSIAAALRDASPGSHIVVHPGVYREGLILDKAVHISGAGPAEDIVIESDQAACLLMQAASAQVQGLTLRSTAGIGETGYYTVNIPTGELLLEDCRVISNSLAAVAVHGPGARPIIRRCVIHTSSERGLVVYSHGGGLIEACDIYGHTVCVHVSNHAAPIVRACRIHNGKLGGVTFVEHGNGVLEDCEIVDNGHHGVAVRLASNPIIRRCHIHRNGWNAISVTDTSGAFVEGCDLTENRRNSWDIKDSAKLRVTRQGNRELP